MKNLLLFLFVLMSDIVHAQDGSNLPVGTDIDTLRFGNIIVVNDARSVTNGKYLTEADTLTIVVTPTKLDEGLANKFDTSDITQSTSDNADNKVWSAAASYNSAATKENVSNKVTTLTNSNTDYPSTSAVLQSLATKVDTVNLGIYVYTQAQLTSALNSALVNGGVCIVIAAPDSLVTSANHTVYSNTKIYGLNRGRTKIYSTHANGAFILPNVTNVTISDLEIYGTGAAVDPTSTAIIAVDSEIITNKNIGTSRGINIQNGERINLENLYFHNFTSGGLVMSNVGTHTEILGHGVTTTMCYFDNNYYGIWCVNKAEYSRFSNISCRYNVCGFAKYSGNIIATNMSIEDNRIGYVSGPGFNNSHGNISNSTINHNRLRSIYMQDITGGEILSGLSTFQGDAVFRRCIGVNWNSSVIACGITFDGGSANRIGGCTFFQTYNGGDITPAYTPSIVMTGPNIFVDGSNAQRINNMGTLQAVTDLSPNTTNSIAFRKANTQNIVFPATYVWNSGATQTGQQAFIHSKGASQVFHSDEFYFFASSPYCSGKIRFTYYLQNGAVIASGTGLGAIMSDVVGVPWFNQVQLSLDNTNNVVIRFGDTTTINPAINHITMLTQEPRSGTAASALDTSWQHGWSYGLYTGTSTFINTVTPTINYNINTASTGVVSSQIIRDTTITPSDMKPNVTRSAASTLTLVYGGEYTFTGTTTTYTLPAIVSATAGRAQGIWLTNQGTGNITLNTNASANVLYLSVGVGSLTNTLSVTPAQTYFIRPDGVNLVATLMQ